jgi:hypothetical protein
MKRFFRFVLPQSLFTSRRTVCYSGFARFRHQKTKRTEVYAFLAFSKSFTRAACRHSSRAIIPQLPQTMAFGVFCARLSLRRPRREAISAACLPTRPKQTGRPPRQRGRRLSPPVRARLTPPHGRHHKAPPPPCALTTSRGARRPHRASVPRAARTAVTLRQ